MDSYGTRFLLLTGPDDFPDHPDCAWDAAADALQLRPRQQPRLAGLPAARALAALADTPLVIRDAHGRLGLFDDARRRLLSSAQWPPREARPVLAEGTVTDGGHPDLQPVQAPEGQRWIDMQIGRDGRLALLASDGAERHSLVLLHLGQRWQRRLPLDGPPPRRVAIDPAGDIWVASAHRVTRYRGAPLAGRWRPRPDRFDPCPPNPHPLRAIGQRTLPGGELLALAVDESHLHLLQLDGGDPGRQTLLRLARALPDDPAPTPQPLPEDWPFATDIALLDTDHPVLLIPHDDEADPHWQRPDLPALRVVAGRYVPTGHRYPQHGQASLRFVSSADGAPHYLAPHGPARLYPLPQARFATRADLELPPLDSGQRDTVWHRLYLEACLPPGCRIEVACRVANQRDECKAVPWQPQPPLLRHPLPSELPFHPGWQGPEAAHGGLFELLLQRGPDGGPVRELRGRYLCLRLTLRGDGRHTPAVHALRVHFPRFSWQQAWLPAHMHQQAEPAAAGPANGADVRERLLAACEGLLTPIEERIAAAEAWLDPRATPASHLPRLAALLGTSLPTHWPEARQRAWLAAQGDLQRRRGTLPGLALALDVATDGAVARGAVVPVEDFRLRRTLTTLLGLDPGAGEHPLTLGTVQGGNSRIGESLVLGEAQGRAFLSLFAPELAKGADAAAVARFFDRHAHRLSVVLHGPARALREVVSEVLADQLPAHVTWRLLESDHPFVPGLAPLLGIDTWLTPRPRWRPVVLDETRIGRNLLRNPPLLAPGGAAERTEP